MRGTPSWLSGYAGVILLVSIVLNVAQMLSRTTYGLTLPSMKEGLGLSYSQAGGLTTAQVLLNTIAFFVFGILVTRYSWPVSGAQALSGTGLDFDDRNRGVSLDSAL